MHTEPNNEKLSHRAKTGDRVSDMNLSATMQRPAIAAAEWTCPMHSEIVRDAPGACPRCGMALERRTASPAAENLLQSPTAPGSQSTSTPFRIPIWLGAALFSTVAVYLLWGEHHVHILGALPFVLLAACPLIHIFMHRGHGHDHSAPGSKENHSHAEGKP